MLDWGYGRMGIARKRKEEEEGIKRWTEISDF